MRLQAQRGSVHIAACKMLCMTEGQEKIHLWVVVTTADASILKLKMTPAMLTQIFVVAADGPALGGCASCCADMSACAAMPASGSALELSPDAFAWSFAVSVLTDGLSTSLSLLMLEA